MALTALNETYPLILTERWTDADAPDTLKDLDAVTTTLKRLDQWLVTSDDTVDRTFALYLVTPDNDAKPFLVATVPASTSGLKTTANLIPQPVASGSGIPIPIGWNIKLSNVDSPSAGKTARHWLLGGSL